MDNLSGKRVWNYSLTAKNSASWAAWCRYRVDTIKEPTKKVKAGIGEKESIKKAAFGLAYGLAGVKIGAEKYMKLENSEKTDEIDDEKLSLIKKPSFRKFEEKRCCYPIRRSLIDRSFEL